jgi:hypothetical protein
VRGLPVLLPPTLVPLVAEKRSGPESPLMFHTTYHHLFFFCMTKGDALFTRRPEI